MYYDREITENVSYTTVTILSERIINNISNEQSAALRDPAIERSIMSEYRFLETEIDRHCENENETYCARTLPVLYYCYVHCYYTAAVRVNFSSKELQSAVCSRFELPANDNIVQLNLPASAIESPNGQMHTTVII